MNDKPERTPEEIEAIKAARRSFFTAATEGVEFVLSHFANSEPEVLWAEEGGRKFRERREGVIPVLQMRKA